MVYIGAISTVYSSQIQFFSTCPFALYLHVLRNNLGKKAKLFSAEVYFSLGFY